MLVVPVPLLVKCVLLVDQNRFTRGLGWARQFSFLSELNISIRLSGGVRNKVRFDGMIGADSGTYFSNCGIFHDDGCQ
jgi:hypothetical protein